VRQVIGVHGRLAIRRDVLYVAARAPRPGSAKTRLGRAIGHERATALYSAFVRDLADRLDHALFTVGWYVTPDDAWRELAPLVPASRASGGERCPVLIQPPGDWTERQRTLFATAHTRHERRTILIASDSPQLGPDLIEDAFERLTRDDMVLGPTDDGGYYLVGMRATDEPTTVLPWEALTGVRMSTATVLDEILARAAHLRLRVSLLAATFDVDEAADLDRLIPLAFRRADLAATRTALETLGLVPALTATDERAPMTPLVVGGAR
jgi:uncharacterized protein